MFINSEPSPEELRQIELLDDVEVPHDPVVPEGLIANALSVLRPELRLPEETRVEGFSVGLQKFKRADVLSIREDISRPDRDITLNLQLNGNETVRFNVLRTIVDPETGSTKVEQREFTIEPKR